MVNTDMMDGLRYAITEAETKRGKKPEEVRMNGEMLDILMQEHESCGFPRPEKPTFMGVPIKEDASVYGYKIVTAGDKALEEMAVRVGEAAKAQGVTMEEFLNTFTLDSGAGDK